MLLISAFRPLLLLLCMSGALIDWMLYGAVNELRGSIKLKGTPVDINSTPANKRLKQRTWHCKVPCASVVVVVVVPPLT